MIDARFGAHTRRIWEFLARGLIRAGCSPNAVTLAGLVLVVLASLAYLWHGNSLVYGLCLVVALASDGLDGAVAPPFYAATLPPLASRLSTPALEIEIRAAEQADSNRFRLSI